MGLIMELDDLKQAWQTIDRRLEKHNDLQFALYRGGKLVSMRSQLRPLVWGQAIQMLFGVLVVVLSAIFWGQHREELHLLIAGVAMHIYGVATIIASGITLGALSRIDYAAPVLTMQKQLARVRRLYVLSGMCVGLPHWLLWVPMVMMFFKAAFGADLYLNMPYFVWINLGVGAAGLMATLWFHRWSHSSKRPRLAKFAEDSLTGSSLRKAQSVLDEIGQFERE